jgi:hypothetical protein
LPTKLPDNIKSTVIQQWLTGAQRDKIAVDNGISAGAVTSMVNEWRRAVGSYVSDELRELAVTLRKIGITPAKCAIGFRAAMMMSRLGVQEDNFESFMSDVYNRCNDLGLTPKSIGSYITSLLEFSQSVPFSQIPDHISEKIEEKKRLEQEIEKLRNQLETLQNQKSEAENRSKVALDNHKITEDKLQWYTGIKNELEHTYGLPVDDISKFAFMVNDVKQHFGYDAQKVIKEFSHLDLVLTEYTELQARITELKYEHGIIKKQYSAAQQMLQIANGSLSVYTQLSAMGFGLEELKSLHNTIIKIADAHSISIEEVIHKFFTDIKEHYDGKLGFELKIDKLRSEVNKLTQQELRLLGQINAIPRLSLAVAKLLNILDSDSIEELEVLIDKLHKVGGINAAIKKLTQSPAVLVDRMEMEKEKEKDEQAPLEVAGQDSDTATQMQIRHIIDKVIAQFSSQNAHSVLRY